MRMSAPVESMSIFEQLENLAALPLTSLQELLGEINDEWQYLFSSKKEFHDKVREIEGIMRDRLCSPGTSPS